MRPDEFIAQASQATNLVDMVSGEELPKIGQDVCRDYEIDYDSMSEWRKRMQRGLDLASMVKNEKTYPFKDAANVKYPLITSAALQFNARSYPVIVPSQQIVKAAVQGNDQGGMKAQRGERVADYMSWQLGTDIEEWDAETDKLLVQLPIVGTMVRKVWYDPATDKIRCKVIEPGKFVVNCRVKVLNEAPRVSEEIDLYPVEIQQREASGVFAKVDLSQPDAPDDAQSPHVFIEQHCRLDLDGDEYPEPYIVTVHKQTRQVVRIVADYEPSDVSYETLTEMVEQPVPDQMGNPMLDQMTGQPVVQQVPQEVPSQIKAITRGSYFIDYHFVPSMDGSFWGVGLGLLLGDLSDTVNTIINQTLDAGHYASLGGGFIGSEFRLKGGAQRFRPGEWKTVGSSGQDIKSAIVPMTFPGPDATMLSMLGMLIDAAREVASTQEILTGDTGTKNMTATTTMALIDQGLKVFTAAYKRIFRSLSREFRLVAKLNQMHLSPEAYSRWHDAPADPQADFALQDFDITPVADPNSVTKMQQMAKAQLLMELAEKGMVDKGAALQAILEAADIPDWEQYQPKPDPVQQQMQMQMQALQMQVAQADAALKMADLHKRKAEVEKLRADAIKSLSDADANEKRLQLDALAQMMDGLNNELERTLSGGMGNMAGPPGNGGAQVHPLRDPRAAQGGDPRAVLAGQPGPSRPDFRPTPVGGF